MFGPGTGTIYGTDVACNGNEQRLVDCAFTVDSSACTHSNDVGVICNINRKLHVTIIIVGLKAHTQLGQPFQLQDTKVCLCMACPPSKGSYMQGHIQIETLNCPLWNQMYWSSSLLDLP